MLAETDSRVRKGHVMRSEIFNIEHILGACEKICYFFVVNLFFLLSNIPVLLFFLFIGISQVRTYLPLFMLCMLTVPPSFSAVLYAMNRVVEGRERGPVKDYVKGYRTDFLQKCKLGAGQLFLVFLFWTNIEFFSKVVPVFPLTILFVLLFSMGIVVTPHLYLLVSRYEMSNIAITKTAIALIITRPVFTLGSVAALAVTLAAFELSAGTAVLFMVSVYGFLIMLMSRNMLYVIEKNSKKEAK